MQYHLQTRLECLVVFPDEKVSRTRQGEHVRVRRRFSATTRNPTAHPTDRTFYL